MLEVKVNLPEGKEFIKEIADTPGKLFDFVRYNVRESVSNYTDPLMDTELSLFLGRERYKRSQGSKGNYRNWSYFRSYTLKGIGEVKVKVPWDRMGEFPNSIIPRSRQYEDNIREDLSLMYLSGVSMRTLSMISKRLVGRVLSHNEVSRANHALTEGIENWRNRDLSKEGIKYLLSDGILFSMRVSGSI